MIGLTVLIFGGAVLIVSYHLRGEIRQQIISRDAEILYSVALMQQFELDEEELHLIDLDDPATQLEIVLKTTRLRTVIAARLFDRNGRLIERFPPTVSDATLPGSVLRRLEKLQPLSRFSPKANLDEVTLSVPDPDGAPFPLLEVNIPLHRQHDRTFLGAAQFIIDGESVAQQFADLDQHLVRQGGLLFLAGGALISLGLHQAFRRLQRANRLLSQRTTELLRANKELVLASKTSALGALTAHLIHGLKNPLFGLRNLTAQYLNETTNLTDPSWRTAAATADQMQAIVNEVVRVLQDEQAFVDCHISLADIVDVLQARFSETACSTGVHFTARTTVEAQLSHRAANLVLLILQNLLQNAFQATPRGRKVELVFQSNGAGAVCEVLDQGPGLPSELQDSLFAPCKSAKPQSSGLGLAISKQLANHLGAELHLKRSTPNGCTFVLSLPNHLFLQNTDAFAA